MSSKMKNYHVNPKLIVCLVLKASSDSFITTTDTSKTCLWVGIISVP